MDEQLSKLVERAVELYKQTPPNQRLMIAIGGAPGSGKTILANKLVDALNQRLGSEAPSPSTLATLPSKPEPEPEGYETADSDSSVRYSPSKKNSNPHCTPGVACFVPMDGYHYTLAYLNSKPAAERDEWWVFRRGSPWTFNGKKFLRVVQKLRAPLTPETESIYIRSFGHEVKDPVRNGYRVEPFHRILVFEGNYLLLDDAVGDELRVRKSPLLEGVEEGAYEPVWSRIAALMDQRWFVESPLDKTRERLAARHFAAGMVEDLDAGRRRADRNDLPNAKWINEHRVNNVDWVVHSVEDPSWAPSAK